MSLKVKKIKNGIQASPMIYGNALSNTMKIKFYQQKAEDPLLLSIMKRVSTTMMQGSEKNTLKQVWVKDI